MLAGSGCSNGNAATTYCVFESGALFPGPCATECQSRCNLIARAGCTAPDPDCVTRCTNELNAESATCQNADYAHWRCLRLVGAPAVSCADAGAVRLVEPSTLCTTERAAMEQACGPTNADAQK
jgi:hypothetical protein